MYRSLYGNLRLWSIIINESSCGEIECNEKVSIKVTIYKFEFYINKIYTTARKKRSYLTIIKI